MKYKLEISNSLAGPGLFFSESLSGLCGNTNFEPLPLRAKTGFRLIAVTWTGTALQATQNGLRRLKELAIVKVIAPNGAVVWSRTLFMTTPGVATTYTDEADRQRYLITGVFSWFRERPYAPGPGLVGVNCLSVVPATARAGQQYIVVTLGARAYEKISPPTVGQQRSGSGTGETAEAADVFRVRDKTTLNIWVLNGSNGAIVNTFKPRLSAGLIFMPRMSSVYDIDNDGQDELVLVRQKLIGAHRYDFTFASCNLLTAALEQSATTSQFNRKTVQQ